MTEKLQTPEHHQNRHETAAEVLPVRIEKPRHEIDPAKKLHKAREAADLNANKHNPIEELRAAEKASRPTAKPRIDRELRTRTLNRELLHIQRTLPATQRSFSKLIHQPVVRAVSEATSQTVSRPSGLLGGGLVAFLGTSGYLYLAKHLGLRYNYLIFLLLFIAGFAFGLVLELAVHRSTASRRTSD